MSIKQVRVSSQAKEQLIRLKTRTGIGQWNVMCRWALCVSLREPTPPSPVEVPADSNVEMSWHVFGGEQHELYLALVKSDQGSSRGKSRQHERAKARNADRQGRSGGGVMEWRVLEWLRIAARPENRRFGCELSTAQGSSLPSSFCPGART